VLNCNWEGDESRHQQTCRSVEIKHCEHERCLEMLREWKYFLLVWSKTIFLLLYRPWIFRKLVWSTLNAVLWTLFWELENVPFQFQSHKWLFKSLLGIISKWESFWELACFIDCTIKAMLLSSPTKSAV